MAFCILLLYYNFEMLPRRRIVRMQYRLCLRGWCRPESKNTSQNNRKSRPIIDGLQYLKYRVTEI